MSIKIVAANPEHSATVVAELIWSADPALMNYLFQGKPNWLRVCTREWPRMNGLVAHARAHVAIDEDAVVGILVTHDPTALDTQFEASAALWTDAESPDMIAHLDFAFTMMDRLFPHPPQDAYYVLDLAVGANVRRAGTGRQLMDVASELARSLGKRSLRLDVAKDNPAVAFYERIGMEIGMETRVPYLETHGVAPHYHMILPL